MRKDGTTMKKLIALGLALMMLPAAACAEPSGGAWRVAESTAVTEERSALLDLALEELPGVVYEPVSYLGSQAAAGLRHCYLCRATVVYPGAEPYLALVYMLEAAEGSVLLEQIVQLDLAALSTCGQ